MNNKFQDNAFSFLEMMIVIVLFTIGAIAVVKAFSVSLFAYADAEKTGIALNIAQAEMEGMKNTAFTSLSDKGPLSYADFPGFLVSVDIAEGQNPMPVDVVVSWEVKDSNASITLSTVVADY
ncbi:MAG: type II secretion system protein [Candidatus Omnitrophota bacterium]